MKLKVKGAVGLGMSAEVCLGWCDTKGYHMVGIGGQASHLVTIGVNCFAGRSNDGKSFKVLLGIGNFDFEYVIVFPDAERGGARHLAIVDASAEADALTSRLGRRSRRNRSYLARPALHITRLAAPSRR